MSGILCVCQCPRTWACVEPMLGLHRLTFSLQIRFLYLDTLVTAVNGLDFVRVFLVNLINLEINLVQKLCDKAVILFAAKPKTYCLLVSL
jgi:hypothetical protein